MKLFQKIAELVKNLGAYFLPPEEMRKHRDFQIKSYVYFTLYAILLVAVLSAIYLGMGMYDHVISNLVTGVVLIIALFYLRKTGNLRLIINVVLTGVVVNIFYMSAYYGRLIEGTGLAWLAIVPLSSGFFNNLKDTAVITVCILLGLVGVWYDGGAKSEHIVHLVTFCGVVCSSATFTAVFRFALDSAVTLINERNQKVRNLLRVVLHDLSNPLAVGGMAAEMMKKKKDRSEKYIDRMLDKIIRSMDKLEAIVEEVAAYEASESGKQVVDIQSVSILRSAEEVKEEFQERLSDKGIKLDVQQECSGDPKVFADPGALQHHIMANLISNAIKFSERDSKIVVRIKENKNNVVFTVEDSGIGMPKDVRDSIFDVNKPTNRKGTEGERGTGFGMPIVKSYVDRFGGQISVSSEEGEGTQFEVELKKAS